MVHLWLTDGQFIRSVARMTSPNPAPDGQIPESLLEGRDMTPTAPRRSQAWFPGTYVPLRHYQGAEVLPEGQRRGGVQVAKTTIHGTAAELRFLAVQLLAAAEKVDPSPRVQRQVDTARRMRAA
jgi:hypothetical protein